MIGFPCRMSFTWLGYITFHDAQDSMGSLVWHKDQKAVSQFLAAILHRIETLNYFVLKSLAGKTDISPIRP